LASKSVFIRYDGVEYFDCDFPSRFQVVFELLLCEVDFAMWSTPVVGDHLDELVNRRVGIVHQLFLLSGTPLPHLPQLNISCSILFKLSKPRSSSRGFVPQPTSFFGWPQKSKQKMASFALRVALGKLTMCLFPVCATLRLVGLLAAKSVQHR